VYPLICFVLKVEIQPANLGSHRKQLSKQNRWCAMVWICGRHGAMCSLNAFYGLIKRTQCLYTVSSLSRG